jgi:hypothetical protein
VVACNIQHLAPPFVATPVTWNIRSPFSLTQHPTSNVLNICNIEKQCL